MLREQVSSSCTVHSTCLVFIIEKSQCGDGGPYNHNRNSAEFLLTDGFRGMSVPKMVTVVLLQARRRVATLAQLHAAWQRCAAMGPLLQRALSCLYMLFFSKHCSVCAGALISVLLTTNSLYLL